LLYNISGVITGKVGAAADGSGGTTYFTISVNATGQVTFTQTANIWSPTAGNRTSGAHDETAFLSTGANQLRLVKTVTDKDGDSASDFIELGSNNIFGIQDDGPVISSVQDLIMSLYDPQVVKGKIAVDWGTDGFSAWQNIVQSFISTTATANPNVAITSVLDNAAGTATLEAKWSSGEVFYRLKVLSSGSYEFELITPPLLKTSADLRTIPSGNFSYVRYDADVSTNNWGANQGSIANKVSAAAADFTITAQVFSSGEWANATINTSTNGIGVADQHFEANERINIAFDAPVSQFDLTTVRAAGASNVLVVKYTAKLDGVEVHVGYLVANDTVGSILKFDPPGLRLFNSLEIEGLAPGTPIAVENLSGTFATISGSKFTLAQITSAEPVPQDYSLQFTLQGLDRDGDLSNSVLLNVALEGSPLDTGTGLVINRDQTKDTLSASSDSVVFALNSEGGADIITGFAIGSDVLDLSKLLSSQNITASGTTGINNYLRIVDQGTDSGLWVDSDGTGAASGWVKIAELRGVDVGATGVNAYFDNATKTIDFKIDGPDDIVISELPPTA